VTLVIYKLWRTFATRFVQAGGGNLVTLNDILGHSSLRSAIQYVRPTAQLEREALKPYRSCTPFAGCKRITAAQKLYVGRTRNRTRDVSSLLAIQQKVCKTSTPQFDPGPRLQVLPAEPVAGNGGLFKAEVCRKLLHRIIVINSDIHGLWTMCTRRSENRPVNAAWAAFMAEQK
jgi:hypothetical protein